MQHVKYWVGLAAPLALIGVGPAWAEQSASPPAPEASGVNEPHPTRQLESEIEEYPGPNDGVRQEGVVDTRIPEAIHPAPRAPSKSERPHAAPSARPSSGGASTATLGTIDPREVQRVFGSDARVIPLASLDAARITQLQLRLRELGHYHGTVDGVAGPQTKAALLALARAQFTLKQRLLQQEQLTSDLAEQLGVAEQKPSGEPFLRDDADPSMRRNAPPVPPGGAPLPPPGIAPLPTPSSFGPSGTAPRGTAPSAGGAMPTPTPPAP